MFSYEVLGDSTMRFHLNYNENQDIKEQEDDLNKFYRTLIDKYKVDDENRLAADFGMGGAKNEQNISIYMKKPLTQEKKEEILNIFSKMTGWSMPER